jgi:hypothetical protein
MPSPRTTLLTMLLCLVVAAPAAASERSEARRYAAAMHGGTELTAADAEALVAGVEARSAHVVATCMPSVEAAAKRKGRRDILSLLYSQHLSADIFGTLTAWLEEADDRLAAIHTRSTVLRRGRAARRDFTRFIRGLGDVAPEDFCATVTEWEARGFKGAPAEAEALVDLFVGLGEDLNFKRWGRASKLLKRHGATRAERAMFDGEPDWPELREPAKDPVADLLMPERDSSEGAGTRQPWETASGADAG